MPYSLREFVLADYEAAMALWRRSEGIGLSSADSPEAIERYLSRNPGTSFVAVAAGKIVGTVLCGHDGRRGYVHHLAIDPEYRGQGIGRALADRCVQTLGSLGLDRAHLFVRPSNEAGKAFWSSLGWFERDDIAMFSIDTDNGIRPAQT